MNEPDAWGPDPEDDAHDWLDDDSLEEFMFRPATAAEAAEFMEELRAAEGLI